MGPKKKLAPRAGGVAGGALGLAAVADLQGAKIGTMLGGGPVLVLGVIVGAVVGGLIGYALP